MRNKEQRKDPGCVASHPRSNLLYIILYHWLRIKTVKPNRVRKKRVGIMTNLDAIFNRKDFHFYRHLNDACFGHERFNLNRSRS
jgi:hypothetical protein